MRSAQIGACKKKFKIRKQLVSLHKTKVKQMTPVVQTNIPKKEFLSQKKYLEK